MTKLFLFQIGPVQPFIASARKTQDLYVGSRILSAVARAGVERAYDLRAELLFPVAVRGVAPLTTPHRFAFLSDGPTREVAVSVNEAMTQRWTGIADAVRDWIAERIGGGAWVAIYDRQIAHWLEMNWVAVPYDVRRHGACFGEASRALAIRRNARPFAQLGDEDVSTKMCTLTGATRSLPIRWDVLRQRIRDEEGVVLRQTDGERAEVRDGEELGAVALMKRFASYVRQVEYLFGDRHVRFPDANTIGGLDRPRSAGRARQVEGFLAVLHMDGDSMGRHLAGLPDSGAHRKFSAILSGFAEQKVPSIVRQFPRAELVYSGGDDVLALAPLSQVLALADALRSAFHDATGLTMSAGIAVSPSNMPLDTALADAREAEHLAKRMPNKSALAVMETHRASQIRTSVAHWESLAHILELQQLFKEDVLSGKLGRDLMDEAAWLAPDLVMHGPDGRPVRTPGYLPPEIRQAELHRLLRRRTAEGVSGEVIARVENLLPKLAALGEEHGGWESLANWTVLARFLASEGQA